jgi:hypothetical protein
MAPELNTVSGRRRCEESLACYPEKKFETPYVVSYGDEHVDVKGGSDVTSVEEV